ncbi:PLP-dependent aminotransferase family protein [Bacillus infantis]|uniref:aminotransferase-like domain-containing protein n=1 Tax=Bacillus infantis TaxID=324767 RepID=UPI002155F708|nr:PLP-dependent aminotransferase family protein [Bacillus infantis]
MRKQPKYLQIAEYIKERISTGEWPVGSIIPSQRELAKQFGVNRSTSTAAIEELMAEGLLEGAVGRGTAVVNNTWTLMNSRPHPNWNENVEWGIHQASLETVRKINESESDSGLIQLSKGELSPDMFPLGRMRQIMNLVSAEMKPFGYEEPRGNKRLRQAVSSYLEKRGLKVSPSSILIVSGSLQALHLISIGLLQKGTKVYLEDPSYLNSLSVFQSAGMKLKGLPMDEEGIIPASIPSGPEGKSVLYCNPTFHNPTGALSGVNRRRNIVKECSYRRIPIIEDDVYRDLWLEESPPAPMKAEDSAGNILYTGSLSKTLTPGLRIGWLAGPEPVIERLADLKMQSDYGSSSLSQQIAARWLEDGSYDQHLHYVREELRIRREAAAAELEKQMKEYAVWTLPRGGFFIWIQLRPEYQRRNLFEKALSKGILLNPGSIYSPKPDWHIRLSYAFASIEEIKEGIAVLASILKEGK